MSTKQVLVIDDDENMSLIIKACLELMGGFSVTVIDNGEEGLRWAETEQPAAILIDFMLPEMNGVAIFQRLQANSITRKIPVILLTAKVHSTNQAELANLGFAAVIAKPFDPMTLVDQITAALKST